MGRRGLPQTRLRWVLYVVAVALTVAAGIASSASPSAKSRTHARGALEYSTYTSWDDLVTHANASLYPPLTRISDPGTADNPVYTGFWWYGLEQFDPTGRYALAMRTHIQNQPIRPANLADVGYYDLDNGNRWHKIGETNAWNYQQGARLQWRPGSDEILWNDRTADNQRYVTRVYDFSLRKIVRTLPRPIYIVSPDGQYALSHDFDRAKKPDVRYCDSAYPDDCIYDPNCSAEEQAETAPACTGIWKIDLRTGASELILSLAQIAAAADPAIYDPHVKLWIMREGWNPSGTRLAAFVMGGDLNQVWTMANDGTAARAVYTGVSHQTWLDDTLMLEGRGFRLYNDVPGDTAAGTLFDNGPRNAHVTGSGTLGFASALPNRDWVLADTYPIPKQYLFLFHRPTGLFIPLARLPSTAGSDIYRVDLQARTSRDGRTVTIDSSYEGLGRQLYALDIGPILDNPPG